MSNMTSESKDIMMSDDCVDSPSFDEASSGGNVLGGSMLKKGPWTSAEDAILVDYVNKHGEGNWNAVQKHSGLFRCGKSCRLRWANHLRPDLKKGAFTPEEERRIIELHAKMGNKWARMAVELPGRTDNEIKNFWNTRIKRRQRAGLPIYPPDICSQALNENQQSYDMGTFSTGNTTEPENFPTFSLDIPALELECLELNPSLYHPPTFLDIASQVIDSSYSNSLLRPPIPGFFDSSEKIFRFSSSYDDSLNAYLSSSLGSHAPLNGNFSSSGPVSAVSKIELPSLQYSDTQVGSWGLPSSPLPSLESVDTLIQSPPSEPAKPDSLSPQNNGLLESVLYESRTKKKSKNNSWHQYSDGSVAAGAVVDGLTQLRDSEWEVYGDPNSPLGHSATSVFSEYTPVSGSSFDDPESVETVPEAKQEAVEWDPTQYDRNSDTSNQMKFSRPDFLLGLSWFDLNTERGKDRSILADAIERLHGKDSSSCSFKRSASSSSGQEGGHGSCEWK